MSGGSAQGSLSQSSGGRAKPCGDGRDQRASLRSALSGGTEGKEGLGSNCALLGAVLGQRLLVIKPRSTGVLPLGLNTKPASETSLII